MKGSGAERPPAMLGMVEADHSRMSERGYADKVCPFVAEVVAHKHISVSRDMVDDGPEYRSVAKHFLAVDECSFFAGNQGERRLCLQMTKKVRAAAEQGLVAVQGAINISKRQIVEQDHEKVLVIKIA